MSKKKISKKTGSPESLSFMAVLILFAGFSIYSFVSFFNSTNDYIDGMQANVAGEIEVAAPPECQTCPPFPICSSVCPDAVEEAPYAVFTDLMSTDSGGKAVSALLFAGIINGYEDGTFKPLNPINRAELLTILANAVDADMTGPTLNNCFTDVKAEWFSVFVCYAKITGWVSGYQDGSYRPASTVNKAEALKIVLRSLNYEIPSTVAVTPYSDVPANEWYAPHAVVAAQSGVVNGSGIFDAGHLMNRVEFAEMVYNAMKFKGLIK